MTIKRLADRRAGNDRRKKQDYCYDGPERRVIEFRRSGFDRRDEGLPACAYCGIICNVDRKWSHGAFTADSKVERLVSLCPSCLKEKYPNF